MSLLKFIFPGILLTSLFIHPGYSQTNRFERTAAFDDSNTVYHYEKSNWDGSHRVEIFVYLAGKDEIQAFKWSEGEHSATLVKAWMDWNYFSIRRFENWKVEYGEKGEMRGFLDITDGRNLSFEFGDFFDTLTITELPWHSYDFDFAGLGFSWRALINKKKDFYFHIADAIFINDRPAFVNKGRVYVKYKGKQRIGKTRCLAYEINGEGLENKGGKIWIDPKSFMIRRYQIELPDEPGFDNILLNLIETKKLTEREWDNFLQEKLK